MNDIETRFNLLEAKLSRQEKLIEANKKKKKQSGGYLAFTTGFPEHDDKMFNQAMGTDFPKDEENAKPGKPEDIIPEAGTNPAPEAADIGGVAGEAGAGGSMGGESAGDAGAAAGGEGGAMGEALEQKEGLTEETKRYVKRYYIRPQNIFCSNKTEILRAFVDLGEENCSVYSLKSLSDHDDVQLLKPSDIIYYYDDGIIYDKNHVKVMDYDLSPKHEEERAKQDVNSVSDAAFAANYDDRLTDIETDSTIKVSENLSEDTIIFEETTCKDGYHIVCRQDKYAGFEVVGGPETQSGEYRDEIHKNFTNKNIALKAYYKIIGEHNASESKGIIEEVDHLGLDFPAITESKLHEDEESCCICGEPINGYSNNAEPYKAGRCCDACNMKFVIPARLAELGYGEE